jgi:hypothetical protein
MQHFMSDEEKKEYAKYHPVSGRREIETGNLREVFPEAFRQHSRLMTEALAKDLRGWLVEPDFAATQREPLILDTNQKNLVNTWPALGYRRIKGPAGSGKSLVLAARAAHRAKQGKTVLILTFNITLWHYLKDLVVRGLGKPHEMSLICFRHFHLFCKDVCKEAGLENEYKELFEQYQNAGNEKDRNYIFGVAIPELARTALETGRIKTVDTIMVDEGQDYKPEWWNILRKALSPDGEMLLVADATQDVYGTGKAWTDEVMNDMGFTSGRWAQLKMSYRLPTLGKAYARDFADRFLPSSTADVPDAEQMDLALETCRLRWVQCRGNEGSEACVKEIRLLMLQTGSKGLANADITYLTDDTRVGEDVVARLTKMNVNTVSTFDHNVKERRREKMGFYMGDARIKATTLHSFKGWESRLLVVYVSDFKSDESRALIYVALTRLKRSPKGSWLTVVCTSPDPKLVEYGKTWPDHHECEKQAILFHATASR